MSSPSPIPQQLLDGLESLGPAFVLIAPALAGLMLVLFTVTPKPWSNILNSLRQEATLSLSAIAAVLMVPAPKAFLVTVGSFRANRPYQHYEKNTELIDLYERCWTRRFVFWLSDNTFYLFLCSFGLGFALATGVSTQLGMSIIALQLLICLLSRIEAKRLSESVFAVCPNSKQEQINYPQGRGISEEVLGDLTI